MSYKPKIKVNIDDKEEIIEIERKLEKYFPCDAYFDLSNCKIVQIDLAPLKLTPFKGHECLTTLNLSSNEIEQIDLTMIKEFGNCFNLSLSNNKIKQINLIPLKGREKLGSLRLSNNKIKQIDLSPLEGNEECLLLDLSNNKIDQINLKPLGFVPHLEILKLKGNLLNEVDIFPLYFCYNLKNLEITTSEPLKEELIDNFTFNLDRDLFLKFHDYKKCFHDQIFEEIQEMHYDDSYFYDHLTKGIDKKDWDYIPSEKYVETYVELYGIPEEIIREVRITWKYFEKSMLSQKDPTPYHTDSKTFNKRPYKGNWKTVNMCDTIFLSITNYIYN